MKQSFSALVLFLGFVGALHGQQTAYEALRAVGSQKGQGLIGKVLLVEGSKGTAQPQQWDIALQDETARGGIRSFEVAGGAILSEKAPVRPAGGGTSMDLGKLNLDSDGAFRLANAEALKAKIGFDSANYRLAPDPTSGAPFWTVELADYGGKILARVEISATDGAVKHFIAVDTGSAASAPRSGEEDGFFDRAGRTLKKAGEDVSRTTKKAAGDVHKWAFGNKSKASDD